MLESRGGIGRPHNSQSGEDQNRRNRERSPHPGRHRFRTSLARHTRARGEREHRAQIESAPPLDFPPAPPRELRTTIRIEVAPDGLHVTAEYTGTLAALPDAIERLRAAGVFELVAASRPSSSAQASPAAGQPRKGADRVEPVYKPDGTPCCPVHHKSLTEGRFGLYCPAKAQPGEQANAKGYCSLRFAE